MRTGLYRRRWLFPTGRHRWDGSFGGSSRIDFWFAALIASDVGADVAIGSALGVVGNHTDGFPGGKLWGCMGSLYLVFRGRNISRRGACT